MTVTVHTPAVSVVQELGGVAVPAPVHVYATVAPSTGSPSLRVAVIVNTCGAFTAFVADGDTVTSYATHVFDVSTGGTGRLATGVPSTSCPRSSVPSTSTCPAPHPSPRRCTSRRSSRPSRRSTAARSTDPDPKLEAVNVVPSGTGDHVVPSADCSTVAVNVCGTPTRFVAGASNDTRYPNHVFDAVNGTV